MTRHYYLSCCQGIAPTLRCVFLYKKNQDLWYKPSKTNNDCSFHQFMRYLMDVPIKREFHYCAWHWLWFILWFIFMLSKYIYDCHIIRFLLSCRIIFDQVLRFHAWWNMVLMIGDTWFVVSGIPNIFIKNFEF